MKKSVLSCNRCTVVTPFLKVNFVPIKKEGILGTRLIIKKKLSEPANSSALDRARRNF